MLANPTFFITDVFTKQKYSGNQLATFIDCESLSDADMQNIAKEINFSETTFIGAHDKTSDGYNVRIFTPLAEIDFAGHPALGTAYIIQHEILKNEIASGTVKLNLPVGQISVSYDQKEDNYWVQQIAPQFGKVLAIDDMAAILSIDQADIDSRWPITEVSTGFPHIIVPVCSLEALKKIQIQRNLYDAAVQHAWAKNILVFSPQAYEHTQSLAVRVFAGYYGIDEDAATGSGNGSLAAYVVENRYFSTDAIDIKVGQGYEIQRPAELCLRAEKTQEKINVFVGGGVCRVARGEWF